MRDFFSQLLKKLVQIFSGRNLRWHFLAIVLTFIIVETGFDWKFFVFVSGVSWRSAFFPALAIGGLLPIILPLVLLLGAYLTKNKRTLTLGIVEAQAVILGSFVSSLYKTFTGRLQPPVHFHSVATKIAGFADNSHAFQFGFWRHGIFWGWPSSHTTLACAMAAAAWVMFPQNKIVRTIAFCYAMYVGLGVAVTSIHWFSEAVAGALIGIAIGMVVGKSYVKKA